MATNKERIERIEADIGNLQNKMEQIEIGINDKLQRLEDTLSGDPCQLFASSC